MSIIWNWRVCNEPYLWKISSIETAGKVFKLPDCDSGFEFIQSSDLFNLFGYKVSNCWSHVRRDGL